MEIKMTFDVSSTNIGWCVEFEGTKHFNNIKIKEGETFQNINELIQKIKNIIGYVSDVIEYKIIFETPKMPFKGSISFGKQKEALGILKTFIFNEFQISNDEIQILEIQSSEWMKYFDFDKNLKKNKSVVYLQNLGVKIDDDNAADALCMMECFDKVWNEKKEKIERWE